MIPMVKDVAALVGEFAETIGNRSLLYEKFSFPKVWGQPDKVNDAGRWSILRIVTRGTDLLKEDATRIRRQAAGRNIQPEKADRLKREAAIAEKLSQVAKPDPALQAVAIENTRRLMSDLNRSFGGRVVTFEATLRGRLLVNLAGGVVENAGIALDHCFGLPFLPGSAVKGIARSQALWEIKAAPDDKKPLLLRVALALFGFGALDLKRDGSFAWAAEDQTLAQKVAEEFGASDFKGVASFLPAYPASVPVLVVDMVNPHYPEYYRGKRKSASDDEYPIPNYFPSVESGACFGFAVLLTREPVVNLNPEVLLQHAKGWVERALTQKGAGAKTAAGYGWFALGKPNIAAKSTPAALPGAPEASPLESFIGKWRGRLSTKDNFPAVLPEMATLQSLEDLRLAYEALIPESERRRTKKNSPYWQAFTSGRHADAGKKILQRLGINLS